MSEPLNPFKVATSSAVSNIVGIPVENEIVQNKYYSTVVK
jgi:hypothetical protein